jgi:hypothetical protein
MLEYIPDEEYKINHHYLTHLVEVIQYMGALAQLNCRVLERRIGKLKSQCNSLKLPGTNTENIVVIDSYHNPIKRRKYLLLISYPSTEDQNGATSLRYFDTTDLLATLNNRDIKFIQKKLAQCIGETHIKFI